MQTPSDLSPNGDLAASVPPRSVFANYTPEKQESTAAAETDSSRFHNSHVTIETLQEQIDEAMARVFVYRFLAVGYEYPTLETWQWLIDTETQVALQSALDELAKHSGSALWKESGRLMEHLRPEYLESMIDQHLYAFGHAARGPCPLNEIEYGDLKADPLFQPHRLADLAAFYRAFGLEVGEDGGERQDHLSIELEFMSVLAAKEAYALEYQLDEELLLSRAASLKFLREHLGRWLPAFVWRLVKSVNDGPLGALARFTREFINNDCARFALTPGSEDLVLRPVDETGESLCASCGIQNLLPGALDTKAGQ
jgi:DMSO reductase family type II enzyme chaperone